MCHNIRVLSRSVSRAVRHLLLAAVVLGLGPVAARAQVFGPQIAEFNTSPCDNPDFVVEYQIGGNVFVFAVADGKACLFALDFGPPPRLNPFVGNPFPLSGLPNSFMKAFPNALVTANPSAWATLSSNKIARITTDGTSAGTEVIEFPIPTPNSQPLGITSGPDGNMWFTESAGNKIGRITSTGTITEFPLPRPNSVPAYITPGSDGNLWFTEVSGGGLVGKITPEGVITEFPGTQPGFQVVPGGDGNLWIAAGARIVRTTPTGAQTPFTLPAGSFASTMTNGPDGALYFVDQGANKIGRITTGGAISEAAFPTANSGAFGITTGDDGALWVAESNVNQVARVLPVTGGPNLLAATLPSGRSVQVGSAATAFATMLNTGPGPATGCLIAPITHVPGNFLYQTTDPATNQLTGTPNTPVDIPANGAQTFLMAFTANGPYVPTDVVFGYSCANANSAAAIIGVNTLLLTFSATPVPDVIAVGLTPSNDGFSHTGGPSGTGLFVIAATDIGATGALTARVRVSNSTMPLTPTVCETNPQTGQCKAPPAPTVTRVINHNENTTWTAFLTATGGIAPDPARFRVFFEFVDPNGTVRGSTNTAVTSR